VTSLHTCLPINKHTLSATYAFCIQTALYILACAVNAAAVKIFVGMTAATAAVAAAVVQQLLLLLLQ